VLNYLYFTVLVPSVGAADTGVPRYLGSLIVKVSANACGTFSIGFVQEIERTFIVDPSPKPNNSLPTLQPLLLTVSDCSRQLLSCNPGHCNIDARIAHDRLNSAIRLNANTIQMNFSKTTVGMAAADFEVTIVPNLPGDFVPTISSVIPLGGDPNKTNVIFNRRIQQTRWTCIRDKGSNKRCCMGSLPADADNSRISQPADTFEVVNNLQGCLDPPSCSEPLLPIERCDTDRSLQCSPADLLMVIDLLTGADAFIEVNGDSLPLFYVNNPPYECPNMSLPP